MHAQNHKHTNTILLCAAERDYEDLISEFLYMFPQQDFDHQAKSSRTWPRILCMYVCMYVWRMCTYLQILSYVCMHVCSIYIYIYIYIYIVLEFTHTHAHTHTHTHIWCARDYLNVHEECTFRSHTQIHTKLHTHTYICIYGVYVIS